jgi:hypothetical protein
VIVVHVARLRECSVVLQGCVIVLLRCKVARLRDCAMLILKISGT